MGAEGFRRPRREKRKKYYLLRDFQPQKKSWGNYSTDGIYDEMLPAFIENVKSYFYDTIKL